MPQLPRYDYRKEYESPIHEYRVAAGLTIKDLATLARVNAAIVCSLANGSLAPVAELARGGHANDELADNRFCGSREAHRAGWRQRLAVFSRYAPAPVESCAKPKGVL
jgi:hypothetical protein